MKVCRARTGEGRDGGAAEVLVGSNGGAEPQAHRDSFLAGPDPRLEWVLWYILRSTSTGTVARWLTWDAVRPCSTESNTIYCKSTSSVNHYLSTIVSCSSCIVLCWYTLHDAQESADIRSMYGTSMYISTGISGAEEFTFRLPLRPT